MAQVYTCAFFRKVYEIMKKIIIAEKPSVAQEYAKALKVNGTRSDGFIENNEWIVTWTVGHLVALSFPDKYDKNLKQWKLETIPFIPEKFKYEVINECRKQFNVVKTLYNRDDISDIYYAGDSGRDGLYIQMLVRMLAGHKQGVNERVVWIDSQTEDEILKGVFQAKPLSEYKNMSDSGYMRAIDDYLAGINFSRLISIIYGEMLNSGAGHKRTLPISIGRVMSCVLGMIVGREREIREFKVTNFYRINGIISSDGGNIKCEWKVSEKSPYFNSVKLYSDKGFSEKKDADELLNQLDNKILITSVNREIKKKYAPLFFNLAELQNICSKNFHFTPKETLQIAQSLYEKKLTTYPRTDARVLSSAVFKEIENNLKGLKNCGYAEYVDFIINNNLSINASKYVDDSKITDHYAIIPTGYNSKELTDKEKNVYDLIARRFLATFYPAAEFDHVKFEGYSKNELFTGGNEILVRKCFYDVYPLNNNDEIVDIGSIKELKKGELYDCKFEVATGSTAPPNRYTPGSIILAMENAGNLIEDEELREQIKGTGIGTSATRADIIEKLIKLDYISLNKTRNVFTPTNFGEMVYEVLKIELPEMLSPKITAEWEFKLESISNGTLSMNQFKNEFYKYINDRCSSVKQDYIIKREKVKKMIRPFVVSAIRTEHKQFDAWNTKLICPLCGDEIETTEWGFRCKSHVSKTEGCRFTLNGDILGHILLTPELAMLLKNGEIGPFYDFVSTKGKPFAAKLKWNKETNKIDFELSEMPWVETDMKCPRCGRRVIKQSQAGLYKCESSNINGNDCGFFIGKIAGKKLNDKQVHQLLEDGQTDLISGFKNKDGNPFNAFLNIDEHNNIIFRFPTSDDLKTDMRCPKCGGSILSTQYGFMCENYKRKDIRTDDDCDFYVGDMYEHRITKSELKKILNNDDTGFIKFKKDKKEFYAKLVWNREQKCLKFKYNDEISLKCPLCGNGIIKNAYGYYCKNYKIDTHGDGCSFHVGAVAGIVISEDQFAKLILNHKTDLISGFKPKDKNKSLFNAYLTWSVDEGIKFEFDDKTVGNSTESKYICPSCKAHKLKESNYNYYCECGFKTNKNIASVEIPKEQFDKLFTYGRTDVISGFFSTRKRKMFAARLVYDDKDKKISFSMLDIKGGLKDGN